MRDPGSQGGLSAAKSRRFLPDNVGHQIIDLQSLHDQGTVFSGGGDRDIMALQPGGRAVRPEGAGWRHWGAHRGPAVAGSARAAEGCGRASWMTEDAIVTPTIDSTERAVCEPPRVAPVPRYLVRLASLVLGGALLATTAAAASAAEEHKIPTAPPEFLALENPIAKEEMDEKFLKKTARLYKRKCKSCHGIEGDGNGSKAEFMEIKPAAFSKPGYLAGRKDGQLYWILMNGSPGTEMEARGPGTRENLSEREIWSLIAYIRHAFTR